MMESESLTSSSPSKPWSQTRRGRLVVFVGIAGLFALVFWMGMMSRRMVAARTPLVVDEQYLSFGEVWETERLDLDLPITNTTKRAIEVTGFLLSCECLEIQPDSLTISPGETRVCHLKIKLFGQQDQNTDVEADSSAGGPGVAGSYRSINVEIVPKISDSTSWQRGWVIRGCARQVASFKPSQVFFLDPLVKGSRFPSTTVKVTVSIPLVDLNVECDSRVAKVSIMQSENNPSEYVLSISPEECLPVGSFAFPIRLRMTTCEGKTLRSRPLSVKGEVVEDVQAIPSLLYLGSQPVGQTVSETVILRSRSGSNFVVDGIENDYPEVTIKPKGRSSSGDESFMLMQHVQASGWHKRKLQFIIRHQHGDHSQVIKVPVQWSFYGMDTP